MKQYLYVSYIREYDKKHDNNDFELIKCYTIVRK